MITIYKYELELKGEQSLSLPADAEILSIQVQNGCICAWVKLDTEKPERTRTIAIYGTGQPGGPNSAQYIATLQMGSMVWHFFEL